VKHKSCADDLTMRVSWKRAVALGGCLGACVASLYALWGCVVSSEALTVDNAVQFVDRVEAGKYLEIPFTVRNHADHVFLIVGNNGSCREGGCIFAPACSRLELPAKSAVELIVGFHVKRSGPFELKITVFTDCPECGLVDLEVKGNAFENAR
jgi:hypothetical protein